jgi:hypothetical protein
MFNVLFLDHCFDWNITKTGDFLAGFLINRMFASAYKNLGLNSDFPEFGHALLGWFGLEFPRSLDEGNKGDMNEEAVSGTGFDRKLPKSFEEG